MASILDYIAGTVAQKDYYSEDPFFSVGKSILSAPIPAARNNTEAFLMPFLQGTLGGALAGYGKSQATQAAFQDALQNPYIAQFRQEHTPAMIAAMDSSALADLQANPFYKYLSDEAPEGYTPKIAQADQLQALLVREAVANEAEKKADTRAKLQEMLLKDYGAVLTDEGIKAVPELASAKGALKRADKLAELAGESEALGYNPKAEEETDKLRKEFSGLPEVKNFAAVEKAGKIISQAVADDSSVADQELVRYSIQLIEPGMAVREGEQRAVAASQSIPEAWKGQLEKALSGKSALGTDVREGIKRLAERAYQGNKEQYDRTLSFYYDQARLKNLDPSRISYIGESAPSLATKVIGGQTYYKVDGGWRKK